jgi:hypothetical protein
MKLVNITPLGWQKWKSRSIAVRRLQCHWTLLQANLHKVRRMWLMAVGLTDMATAFVSHCLLFIHLWDFFPQQASTLAASRSRGHDSTILFSFSSTSHRFINGIQGGSNTAKAHREEESCITFMYRMPQAKAKGDYINL